MQFLCFSLYCIHIADTVYYIIQVPNTIEFADWIGRTKQKKIRVTG